MQIEEDGYYRDRVGRIWGPMRQKPGGDWLGVHDGLSWLRQGLFIGGGEVTDYDFVERVYVSTTPPVAVKIDEASLPRVKQIINTIDALRLGQEVAVTGRTEIGARVALSDYYKGELRALGLAIE